MNYKFNTAELLFAMPEIFMLIAISIIILADLFTGKKHKNLIYYLTQITLIIATYLTFNLIGENKIILNGHFVLDNISSILKIFTLGFSFVALLYTRHYLKIHNILKAEYFLLTLMSILGMMIIISAYSLLTIYLGLEIMSLCLYSLIAITRNRSLAVEASLKYFILGAIASGLLLYGISMIYGITGSLNIQEISFFVAQASNEILIINFGLVFLVIGIAFKLGAVPFHMWAPDVYEGAPTPVTMFLSSVTKIAILAMLIRLLVEGLGGMHNYWSDLFIILAILSIVLGSLVALTQSNIKRLLAYSTISHIGFVLLGFVTGTISGYGAAIFYILTYALTVLAVFAVIILLNKKGFEADKISNYKELNKKSAYLALIMLVAMLSMAGIPPFVGFYAKLFILQEVISSGHTYIAVFALIFAVISAYYYLYIIKTIYFDKSNKDENKLVVIPMDIKLILSINAALILIIGIMPNYWIDLAISIF